MKYWFWEGVEGEIPEKSFSGTLILTGSDQRDVKGSKLKTAWSWKCLSEGRTNFQEEVFSKFSLNTRGSFGQFDWKTALKSFRQHEAKPKDQEEK